MNKNKSDMEPIGDIIPRVMEKIEGRKYPESGEGLFMRPEDASGEAIIQDYKNFLSENRVSEDTAALSEITLRNFIEVFMPRRGLKIVKA